jgi:hypothetical protein
LNTTEQHRIGDYVVKFDRCTHSSRFIVVANADSLDPRVVSQGLIHDDGYHGPRCLCDDEPVPDGVEPELVLLWVKMREELRQTGERPWGPGT